MEFTNNKHKLPFLKAVIFIGEECGVERVEQELGITAEQYAEIVVDFERMISLENYILQWVADSNYGEISKHDAYDLGYDMKSDIEDSEFNPVQKINEEWEQEYDEWFDLFLEEEIMPILVAHGANYEEQ